MSILAATAVPIVYHPSNEHRLCTVFAQCQSLPGTDQVMAQMPDWPCVRHAQSVGHSDALNIADRSQQGRFINVITIQDCGMQTFFKTSHAVSFFTTLSVSNLCV